MLETLLTLDIQLLTEARSLIWPEWALWIIFFWESIVIFVAAFLLFLWFRGRYLGDNRYKVWALEIFFIVILTFVLHFLINLGVPQWRPGPENVVGGIAPLIPHPIDNSFPSGHALFSMAFLVWLIHSYKKYTLIAITLILWIITALARVIGWVHYPGDILGGWIFGWIGAMISIQIIHTRLFRLYIFPLIIRIAGWFKL